MALRGPTKRWWAVWLVAGAVVATGVAGVAHTSTSRAGSAQVLDDFSDFRNAVFTSIFENRWAVPPSPVWTALGEVGTPWADGSGIFRISTKRGIGFRFVQNELVPRGSGNGVLMADVDHVVDQQTYLGTLSDFSGDVMFPRSGNPRGFPPFGDWNVLWEFTQDTAVPNSFGVDALPPRGPRFYVSTLNPGDPSHNRKSRAPSRIVFDRWYHWRWQIKWSEGADGFVVFWLDGKRIALMKGPTVSAASGPPYLEWGWYGGEQPGRNEVRYAGLRAYTGFPDQ
jgi:Polysaccharide lyase